MVAATSKADRWAVAVGLGTDRNRHTTSACHWHRPHCVRGRLLGGPPLVGMLIYAVVVAAYLAYLSIAGGLTGTLLWPGIIVHIILAALLTWASAAR